MSTGSESNFHHAHFNRIKNLFSVALFNNSINQRNHKSNESTSETFSIATCWLSSNATLNNRTGHQLMADDVMDSSWPILAFDDHEGLSDRAISSDMKWFYKSHLDAYICIPPLLVGGKVGCGFQTFKAISLGTTATKMPACQGLYPELLCPLSVHFLEDRSTWFCINYGIMYEERRSEVMKYKKQCLVQDHRWELLSYCDSMTTGWRSRYKTTFQMASCFCQTRKPN